MADSCKSKTPAQSAKKTQEGSGKKRRKHKKPADPSGDGAPSANPVQLNPSQASTSQPPTGSEGASGRVIGVIDSSTSQKKATKKETNVVTVSEPGGKLLSNTTDKDRKTSEVPEKNKLRAESKDNKLSESGGKLLPNSTDKDGRTSVVPEKNIPKAESNDNMPSEPVVKEKVKLGEEHLNNAAKQERKERTDGEHSQRSTSKETGISRKDESRITGMQSGQEKKEMSASGKGGEQKKGNVHEKSEQNLKEKANSERLPAVIDLHPKATVKVNAEARRTSDLGAEHKQQAKGDPEKKLEIGGGEQKSKGQLRAERRAIQEAQRAAKDAKKGEAGGDSLGGATHSSSAATAKKEHAGEKSKPVADVTGGEKKRKKSTSELASGEKNRKKPTGELTGRERKKKSSESAVIQVMTEEQMWTQKENEILGTSLKIDNVIMSLGFQYFHHNIVGANARCMALLATLKQVITKYKTPNEKELSRDLEKNFLNPFISYINYCRPISTSMGNAIRHLKYHINNIPGTMDDETAISKLLEVIDNFIEVNMIKASEAVADTAISKIDNGDVILVYAASSLIGQVLKKAVKAGKKFRVIVVEGRPRSEGKAMLRCLVRCDIPCSYIYIGSASHAMSEATKVFLGAAAMFAIGDMYSRSGNSMIAALAKANNIPVLVCCETYKFTDKVQLHTGDSNLHTRGKDLVSIGHKTPILADWEQIGLGLLNLMYDVTGSQYITAVVTELGMLPCTSVPVVLRRQEDLYS